MVHSSDLVYYSINSTLAFNINSEYYKKIHYVYCSAYFNTSDVPKYKLTNPNTSLPFKIYKKFEQAVINNKNLDQIEKNKIGLLNGAIEQRNKGVITEKTYKAIKNLIHTAEIIDFQPLIYIIPYKRRLEKFFEPIVCDPLGGGWSAEYLIRELKESDFKVLSMMEAGELV